MDTQSNPSSAPVSSSVSESVPSFGAPQKSTLSKGIPLPLVIGAMGALLIAGLLVFVIHAALSQVRNPQTTTALTAVGKKTNLVWWGLWEPNEVLDSVIKGFETANPGVTITYTQQSVKDYRERLQSAFARGQGPDLFRFHNTWVPMLSQTNSLSSIPNNVMSASEFERTYYPSAMKDLKTNDGYVGIPLMTDGLGLYVNKKALSDSGKPIPTTWGDVSQLAKDLTIRGSDGKIQRAGIAMGSGNNVDHFSDILGLLILQNGGNPGKPTAVDGSNNNLVGDALTFYTQFMRVDKVWDETLPNSTYAFAIEKTAMMLAPSWRAFEIKQINPNIDFEVVPVPQLPGKPVTWASYWAEGVSKSAKDPATAWAFLKYMSTPTVLKKLYSAAAGQRLFGEIYPRVDMANELAGDQYAGAYVKEAPTAQSWYLSSRTFDNGTNDQISKYYQDAVNGINSGKQAAEVIPTLNAGVSTVLTKYGISP